MSRSWSKRMRRDIPLRQGAGGGILNDDAVRHGVAEGDADFYHIHSVLFERADNIGCAVERGAAAQK